MDVKINPRENGACPLCRFNNKCILQNSLKKAMKEYDRQDEMEIVVYTCPRFKENI